MRKIFFTICILFVTLFCNACGTEKNSVILIEDSVLMDSKNITGHNFVICFNYLYKGDLPEIKILNIEGKGLDNISFECKDLTDEFRLDSEYKGYKMGAEGITILYDTDNIGENIIVENVTFLIDGVERNLKFQYPLTFTPISEDTNSGLLTPVQVLNGCGIGTEAIFAYKAMADVTINNITLGKYLYMDNLKISIDRESNGEDEEIGSIECFPVELPEGSTIVIRGKISSDYYTGYQNIYTTSVVSYSSSDSEYQQHVSLFCEGVSDEEIIESAIESILNRDLKE